MGSMRAVARRHEFANVAVAVLLCALLVHGAGADSSPWYVDAALRADADALLQFKEGLQDPNGVLRSWNYLQTPCSWLGVECARVGTDHVTRVVGLELKEAKLKGHISFKLGDLSELEVLNLMGNELEGFIPVELGNCRRLMLLDLRKNDLVGSLPPGILTLLPNLLELSVSGNKLSGRLDRLIELHLAPENAPCDHLKLLDLSHNRLTGSLPRQLHECSQLVEVYLGSNLLVGGIPAEYGRLVNLEVLEVQNNILDRQLPQELKSCTKLRTFNMADNFIVGEIPSSFAELRELREFDVARNRLSGHIPQGRWVREAPKFRGNDGLCGSPLLTCKDEDVLQEFKSHVNSLFFKGGEFVRGSVSKYFENTSQPRTQVGVRRSLKAASKNRRSKGARWGLGIAAGLVTGAVAAVLLALIIRVVVAFASGTENLKKPIIFDKKITPHMLAFLDKEDALAGCRLLGAGGNGKVYQVPLQDDLVVAIKCVRIASDEAEEGSDSSHDAKQIRAELETLGFIRHRNLVRLLAYIFKEDSHLLVYEYMPGGSLQDALHRVATGNLTLSWPERHRILCGVAQGLAYLHNESLGSSIVHRDLKPANILLDEGYEAKLGDFGLAAVVPLKATHATTEVLAGTIGFIAPEYHQTMRYSQKSDVFSFGVVIAQLVTARNPTDQFVVENGGSIGQWLHKCLQSSNGVEAIDPALQASGYETEILLAMKIAVFCTHVDPQQRPKSIEVLKMLLQIRNPDPVPAERNLSPDIVESDVMTLPSSDSLRFPVSGATSLTSSY
ncbi:uncharacterized protein [Physcomitrium patens]|uniref:Protein kinase domain-containing protein n=1 Tax=Physcomitrium patens TaxID=3218 RepID=A0A2K1JZ87_PHYPA|nr:receptor-like protein kinase 5 [Physcomitrium patens]PNR46830.1 hypothetical protein PHYPA_013950 [Physcomitrium patens]|eukprot:XP_024385704.1 receptor-like protein kinase 5 [Physcomitrella patens]